MLQCSPATVFYDASSLFWTAPKLTCFALNRCRQDSDIEALHADEMTQAAEAAKAEYFTTHPEDVDIELKCDPLKDIFQRPGFVAGLYVFSKQSVKTVFLHFAIVCIFFRISLHY